MDSSVIKPDELRAACVTAGFVRKSKAYFRAHGDGVLQIIKCEKVRNYPINELNVGLFSLYGELREEWFTSHGCIPRYPITIFEGKRDVLYLKNVNGIHHRCVISSEHQLNILKNRVIPFLNDIKSQAQLAEAICKLDEMMFSKILWNDSLKFAPYLHSGDNESAARVIQAIIDQHHSALERNRINMSSESFQKDALHLQKEDCELKIKLDMAKSGSAEDIQDYLSQNYLQNRNRAMFAFPK